MSAEQRLKQLGIVLPKVPAPVANYVPYRLAGNLLFLSGQGPRDDNGNTLSGKVGAEVSVEEGYKRARRIGLGLLAATRDALGSLDRVEAVLKVLGMVNAVPDFKDHPKVIGCLHKPITNDALKEMVAKAQKFITAAKTATTV